MAENNQTMDGVDLANLELVGGRKDTGKRKGSGGLFYLRRPRVDPKRASDAAAIQDALINDSSVLNVKGAMTVSKTGQIVSISVDELPISLDGEVKKRN